MVEYGQTQGVRILAGTSPGTAGLTNGAGRPFT